MYTGIKQDHSLIAYRDVHKHNRNSGKSVALTGVVLNIMQIQTITQAAAKQGPKSHSLTQAMFKLHALYLNKYFLNTMFGLKILCTVNTGV